jgi:hypothetical protein
MGDEQVGYFGQLSQAELFTAPELRTAVGLTTGTPNVWEGNWIKMFSRGKVIFFPDAGLNNGMSWPMLYVRGITSGRNGFDAPGTSPATIQRKVVTRGDNDYVVRLFHSAPSYLSDIAGTLSMGVADPRIVNSEWSQIICRLVDYRTNQWTGELWKLFKVGDLMNSTATANLANRWYWSAPDSLAGYMADYQLGVNNGCINMYSNTRANLGWYPVLELVTA